ncbi:MAG: M56 family metallopeptidase [Planctomycetota bacterium]
MTDFLAVLDRVVATHLVVSVPFALVLVAALASGARAATRTSLAAVLAAATLLPWALPVLDDPASQLAQILNAARGPLLPTSLVAPTAAGDATTTTALAYLLWLAGSVLATAWLLLGFGAARRRLRAMPQAPEPLRTEVRRAASTLGVAAPDVRLSPTPCSPAVVCAPQATLVLPGALWPSLLPDAREGLLLHELAHLRRHDPLLRAITALACLAAWWNPLVWYLRYVVRSSGEDAADDWVVHLRPDAPAAFGQGLLATQRHLLGAKRASAPAGTAALSAPARHLRARLQRLFSATPPRSSGTGRALLIATGAGAIALSWTAVQCTAEPIPSRTTRAATDLRRSIARWLLRFDADVRPELLPYHMTQLRTALDAEERRRAADAVGNLLDDGAPALPALLDAMADDPSPSVRREAVDAIGRIGPSIAERARPHLLHTLATDPAPRVRREVVDVLGRLDDGGS